MSSSSHSSPNAIPPRRSSTGYTHQPLSFETPQKSTLKPLAESSWMASNGVAASDRDSHYLCKFPDCERAQPSKGFPRQWNLRDHMKRVHNYVVPEISDQSSSSHIDPALVSAYSPAFPTRPSTSTTNDPSFSDAVTTIIHDPSSLWSPAKEKILLGPYDYMYDHPGKDIRKQLITAFNGWLRVPPPSLHIIQKVVGMLHTASLLVDDVEDSSLLRRGVPVAHSIFGTAQTINSANYVYFDALRELLKLGNEKVIQIYTDELCNLHRGQGMDLFWRDTLTCPSEMDYLEMVGNKTGGLFRLAVLLMQAESTTSSQRDFVPLVSTIGLLFQIRDDYLNLSSPLYTSTKGLCEDLTEGKFSFPIIHAIRSNPSNLQLMNILKQKTTDEDVKKYAVKYMEKCGSFEYCRKVMHELHEKAVGIIEEIEKEDGGEGGGKGVKHILDKMAAN